jgi:hypothetical protein
MAAPRVLQHLEVAPVRGRYRRPPLAALVAAPLSAALTLIGYFFVGAWSDLWMMVVNGGGLVLGRLWMRRN